MRLRRLISRCPRQPALGLWRGALGHPSLASGRRRAAGARRSPDVALRGPGRTRGPNNGTKSHLDEHPGQAACGVITVHPVPALKIGIAKNRMRSIQLCISVRLVTVGWWRDGQMCNALYTQAPAPVWATALVVARAHRAAHAAAPSRAVRRPLRQMRRGRTSLCALALPWLGAAGVTGRADLSLSCAPHEQACAGLFATRCKEAGVRVWRNVNLRPGQALHAVTATAARSARAMVAPSSRRSVGRRRLQAQSRHG